MTDQLRPPPLPRSFEDTEPGLGLLAAKQENAQLRMERDKARRERDAARSSSPPPRRHGKRVAIELGKLAFAAPVLIIAGKMAAKRWPEFGDLIDAVLDAVGLQ